MARQSELDFFTALGNYCYHFAFMEEQAKTFINYLVNPSDLKVGGCLTAGMPWSGIYPSLMSLYRYHIHEESKVRRLEEVLNELDKIDKERNRFIHSEWGRSEKAGHVKRTKRTAKFNSGLKVEEDDITPQDILAKASQIVTLTNELLKIREHWLVTGTEWSRKVRQQIKQMEEEEENDRA